MLAFCFVSLRRKHDVKRHISIVRPCAFVIVNDRGYKLNAQKNFGGF